MINVKYLDIPRVTLPLKKYSLVNPFLGLTTLQFFYNHVLPFYPHLVSKNLLLDEFFLELKNNVLLFNPRDFSQLDGYQTSGTYELNYLELQQLFSKIVDHSEFASYLKILFFSVDNKFSLLQLSNCLGSVHFNYNNGANFIETKFVSLGYRIYCGMYHMVKEKVVFYEDPITRKMSCTFFDKTLQLRYESVIKHRKFPLLVKPLDWVPQSHDETINDLFHIENNCTGGYILNPTILKKPLLKYRMFDGHNLLIKREVFRAVNHAQSTELQSVPLMRIASSTKLPNLILARDYTGLLNIINFSNNRLLQISSAFFSYHLDFRMRIYPEPYIFHPMRSKIVRALFEFKIASYYKMRKIQLCATTSVMSTIGKSEFNLIFFFKTKLIRRVYILQQLINPLNLYITSLGLKNFRMFLRSYFELIMPSYRMPIYIDSTASGFQILHLLFNLKYFLVPLNLTRQTFYTVRGDIYSTLLFYFFKTSQLQLRTSIKSAVIALLYNSSFQNFRNSLRRELTYKTILEFWKFLKTLPFTDLLMPVSHWSTNDLNQITMFYKKKKRHVCNITCKAVHARKQFIFYRSIEPLQINIRKQRTSFFANYIHSWDAYVMFQILINSSFCVIPIHDCWGVTADKIQPLINFLKNSYVKLQPVCNLTIFQSRYLAFF